MHTHISTPWPFVVSKMEIRGRGVVESLEIMPTSPQSRPSLPPCYPGAKPPFEIHGLVMRRRSVTVVDSSSKRLTLLWRLGPCLLRTTTSLGPAWRMTRPGDGPSASVMTFPWCPCGFRVDCIAELSAEESAEEMLVWSTTADDEGASGTKKQPANHGRRGLCDGRDRSKLPRLFLRRRPISAKGPPGSREGAQYQASRSSQTRAAQQRNSRQERRGASRCCGEWFWWPAFAAIQPPLRNSCEGREG